MRRIKLCDICDFQGGSQPPKNQWIDSPQYGYIRMLQIRDFTQSEKVKPEYIKITSSSKVCNEDDILIARYGASVGKILTGLAGAYNVAIMKTIPDEEKISKRFLFYFLSSQYFQNYIMNVGSRAAQAGFNKDDLQGISLKEYSLKEQADICSILDEINVIIKKRKKQLKYIENVVKSRFIEMFGDMKLNKRGWKLKSFEELTYLITDGEHATPKRTDKGIYLLSARNILNHSLQLKDVDYINEKEYDRIAKRIIPQEGDILISCSGTVGRCCSVPSGFHFQMVRSVALIRFKEYINPIFAEYMITSDYLQEQINSSKTVSSQANLFQGKIRTLKGFVPPIEMQNEFSVFVHKIDKSKYYNFTSYKYCVLAAKLIRQEWMLCQTLSF